MKFRLGVVSATMALVLAACGSVATPAAIQSAVSSSTSSTTSSSVLAETSIDTHAATPADDPDVQSCLKLGNEFKDLKTSTFDPIVETETIDYGPVSAALSGYAVDVRAIDWKDASLGATWGRVAAAGDASADVLLQGDVTSSADSLSAFSRGVNAAITACSTHLEGLTAATG
jgi:hypothetical protein